MALLLALTEQASLHNPRARPTAQRPANDLAFIRPGSYSPRTRSSVGLLPEYHLRDDSVQYLGVCDG
jgi:hypothetical protein